MFPEKQNMHRYIARYLEFRSLLIISITVIIMPSSNACPMQCRCSYPITNKMSVVCSTQNMNHLPHNLNQQTQLMTITGSRDSPFTLLHLSRSDLQPLTYLEHLTISFTHLSSIEEDSFLDLINLKRVDLANNKLAEILPNTFVGLRNVTFISLSNNPKLVIEDRAFYNLQSLQELYLSGLGLTELRPAMFYGLISLRQLDLSSNKLTSFSPDILVSMPNLLSLDLAFNELMSLDSLLEPFFLHLKRVQLGGNQWQCNCLVRWLKKYPQFIAPRSGDPVVCSAPAGMEYLSLSEVDVQQLVCEPPVIQKCPNSMTVLEGGRLTIRCLVTGDPYPSIVWTMPDGTKLMSGSYPGMPMEDRAAIQVPKITNSMSGNVILTVSNGIGTQTTTIKVTVQKQKLSTSIMFQSLEASTTTPATDKTKTISSSDILTAYDITTQRSNLSPAGVSQPASQTTTLFSRNSRTSTKQTIEDFKNENTNKKGDSQKSKSSDSEINTTAIIVASVTSTTSALFVLGIIILLIKKLYIPRHTSLTKVTPLNSKPNSPVDRVSQLPQNKTQKWNIPKNSVPVTKFEEDI